ncbi:MAG: hypothetical protein WBC70_07655 [Candidatus Aminicenantales bacterium]
MKSFEAGLSAFFLKRLKLAWTSWQEKLPDLPFLISYNWWTDCWYVDLTIIVYERNGVGVNITVIKTAWFEGEAKVSDSIHTDGYVPGNGSRKFSLYSYCPAKYKPTRFTIRLEGSDSNGYLVVREKQYSVNWTSGVLLEIR